MTIPLHKDLNESLYHSTWNLSSARKWKEFQKQLSKNINTSEFSSDPNLYATKLNQIIYDTAVSTIGYREYRRGYKPWWNSEINELKKAVKNSKRKLIKIKNKYPIQHKQLAGYKQQLLEYKSFVKHKIQKIRIAKKIHNNHINSILQNSNFNDKLSWRLIKTNKKNTHNKSHRFMR